ncbi:ATPase [Candidatus Magnetomorum sp. HK-1]|nr:ATPase [Candidatus Magnetomorum sp. HK-1]
MYSRMLYINQIKKFMNKPMIKVITGIRRSGKSCLLKLLINDLKTKIDSSRIIYINKESLEFDHINDYKDLYQYVKKEFYQIDGYKYIFVDEIQEISQWEKAIASIFTLESIDIYITGSNAHLLSSEIATLISGRYIEIPVYTLSFLEFLQFRDTKQENIATEFKNYITYGGFPAIHYFDLKSDIIYQYISSLYDTILLKDLVKRNNIRNVRLLENISKYIMDNIGNIFTSKKVANYMKSQRIQVSVETIQNYISYFESTFAIHKVSRYDIKGKRFLELYEKYYLGDIGLRHALIGFREHDISGILENIVYLELRRHNYQVCIGKFNNNEIDFIATRDNSKIYIQVCYLLSSKETIDREFCNLLDIRDNYPKYVLSMDNYFGLDFDGIIRMNLIDFLRQIN